MKVRSRHPRQAFIAQHGDRLGGIRHSQAGPVGVAEGPQQGVDLGGQHRQDRPLHHPVPDRRHVQHSHPPVRAGQTHRRERARLICPCLEVGCDAGQMLVRVLGEPGDALPEYPVFPVAGQHVRPDCGELSGVGDLSQGGMQAGRIRRAVHGWPGRSVGGCQVGSGHITPNP
jgi:hypothetical protein